MLPRTKLRGFCRSESLRINPSPASHNAEFLLRRPCHHVASTDFTAVHSTAVFQGSNLRRTAHSAWFSHRTQPLGPALLRCKFYAGYVSSLQPHTHTFKEPFALGATRHHINLIQISSVQMAAVIHRPSQHRRIYAADSTVGPFPPRTPLPLMSGVSTAVLNQKGSN